MINLNFDTKIFQDDHLCVDKTGHGMCVGFLGKYRILERNVVDTCENFSGSFV